jgi:uncharacterized damage-inducible protein DinB
VNEFRELFRYGTWANLALVDHCLGLPAEAVEVAVEGTFGPIRETFAHMLEQERWGLWVLKRTVPEFDESSLESIRSTFVRHGQLWQEVIDDFEQLGSIPLPSPDQWDEPIAEFPLMYALQTAHHQELHRTHIRATLSQTDSLPEEKDSTDVWAYWKTRQSRGRPIGEV